MRRFLILTLALSSVTIGTFALIKHYLPNALLNRDTSGELMTQKQRAVYYNLRLTKTVDSIFVIKHLREMYVYRNDSLLKIYRVALGGNPVGPKHFEGDLKTPEGLYRINGKNPFSSCHKNMGVSYPNNTDRAYAHKAGKSTGGDIKIHGLPNGQGAIGWKHRLKNWTWGCIGITDEEIDELYAHSNVGIPIYIVP